MKLDPADIEAIARRVAELLSQAQPTAPVRLLDASQLAKALAVDREWVYAHAHELGGIRLGGGQGRLRFDVGRVLRALTGPEEPSAISAPTGHKKRGVARSSPVNLLPYGELRSTRTKVAGRRANAPGRDTGR